MSTERINNSDLEDYLPSEAKGKSITFSGCREMSEPITIEQWALVNGAEVYCKDGVTIIDFGTKGFRASIETTLVNLPETSIILEKETKKQAQKNWTKFQHYSNRRTK